MSNPPPKPAAGAKLVRQYAQRTPRTSPGFWLACVAASMAVLALLLALISFPLHWWAPPAWSQWWRLFGNALVILLFLGALITSPLAMFFRRPDEGRRVLTFLLIVLAVAFLIGLAGLAMSWIEPVRR